jgi:hypothetical protein
MMRNHLVTLVIPPLLMLGPATASSFCGFYVASGDAKLFNRSSQVVLVRDRDRTVLTMASDFRGEPQQFALVVPVPSVLQKDQVHVGDSALVARLDAFTAPRLVEYHDPDPCPAAGMALDMSEVQVGAERMRMAGGGRNARFITSVRIEARYTVDEYDILILSATESAGLSRWLAANGYRVPPDAVPILDSYIRQGLKFFVAKVNLMEHSRLGFRSLRPIQVAFESAKFVLPLRLGTTNADGPQELFVYALTPAGRVEAVNYRNVRLPTNVEIPSYVKDEWTRFYPAMFENQQRREGMGVVFTEYAWDAASCDPCPAPTLAATEWRELGVYWLDPSPAFRPRTGGLFVTRLHVRYDRAHFPEDLVLQATADRQLYQARYVVRHEWTGEPACEAGYQYKIGLRARRAEQAKDLAGLTGWSVDTIRSRMGVDAAWARADEADLAPPPWWKGIWKR